MTDPKSAKVELIATLDIAWEILCAGTRPSGLTPMHAAQLRGVLDHARAVALRLGPRALAPRKLKPEGTDDDTRRAP